MKQELSWEAGKHAAALGNDKSTPRNRAPKSTITTYTNGSCKF